MQIINSEVSFDTLYKVVNPEAGYLNNLGISEINKFCTRRGIPLIDFKSVNGINIEWRITGKGKYVGTLTKRIAKWLYLEHGIELSQDDMMEIGNICKMHVSEKSTHYLDFTQNFDWQDGDFGDNDSCLMKDNHVLSYMESKKLCAVRLYNPDISMHPEYPDFKNFWGTYKYKYGLGRAWFIVGTGANNVPPNTILLFNGYGRLEIWPTLSIARVVANYFNSVYKEVRMLINGNQNGKIWLNAKKYNVNGVDRYDAAGFLIGGISTLERIEDEALVDVKI